MHFADHLKSYVIVLWRNAGELDFKVIINGYFIIYRLVFLQNGKEKNEETFSGDHVPCDEKEMW